MIDGNLLQTAQRSFDSRNSDVDGTNCYNMQNELKHVTCDLFGLITR